MKRTHMPHTLAKALIEAGMVHYDDGGMVAPPIGGPGAAPMASGGNSGWFGKFMGQNDYNAVLAPTQQTNYGGVINDAAGNALAGYQNAQGIQAQQQELANALLAQSRGEGPNPAQAALAANTGNNVAQQAALMAGQRGAGANAGLLARQAAQQGAATQQGAVGQAATLQAQQQLAAQQALAQQQAAMASGNVAEQGINSNLFGGASGAQNAQNNTTVANYADTQRINAGASEKNSENEAKGLSGILGGIGSAAMKIFAKGGKVPEHLHKIASIYHPEFAAGASDFRDGGSVPGKAAVQGNSLKNDTVPAMLSPGEEVLPRSVTQAKNAPAKAAEFVKHLQEKEGKQSGYSKVAASKKDLKSRVERLEKLCMGGAA